MNYCFAIYLNKILPETQRSVTLKIKNIIYLNSPVWLQNSMVSAFGYYWKRRRFSKAFYAEYERALKRESYSSEQWKEHANAQLQQLLQHAFLTVPYYRKSFSSKKLHYHDLKKITTDSLSQLPVVPKDDFRMFGTNTMLSEKLEPGGIFLLSSGSTGTPTATRFSHRMHQQWFALMESRVRNWAGVSSNIPRGMIGGRIIMKGNCLKPPFHRYNYFEKQAYFSAFHINRRNAPEYLAAIYNHNLEYMTGYAVSNFLLAQNFQQLQLTAPALKAVITSSETLTREMRHLLAQTYHCKVFDSWSGIEACGLVSECSFGRLHIHLDAGIIELLNDHLEPVAPGQPGDVYCTGFLNYDQPLIRYKIGDQMIFSHVECECGSSLPVIKEIVGRCEDVIYGKDGRQMVRFHSVFKNISIIRRAQVCQDSIDQIMLKIIADRELNASEKKSICETIESQLGDIRVHIERVDEIPLSKNGKFKAVISNLTTAPS